ncbi:S1/P1 nuclease [Novosphingobium album (ex Liu et al. 2023)]|uniref:S1/P1 nuclease n=1 Tax=Novosphingobium album (ex Liu et al. 2023) TaxID=3031130 RepID=A0ABT5WVN6_9SPHN|nr:S1/P1 nuclease [Novosphingobium album (ex Liu et al. 2023)]MDE8653944.1 S1/P1 nuclease [Novosphingobium album (ex Liu et al. 2023)]
MRRLLILLAALAGLCGQPAFAWGEYGHRTVAAIAMANISPATRARIRTLLRAEPQLGTPDCPVRSLEDAAVWPDCLRGESWRWAYTFPWHYQNEPVCADFDIKRNCANGNCVTPQIERNRRILATPGLPVGERLMALAFLAHFVGDVHQPLHVGENEDLGGNKVGASYGIAPGRNLHAIWDGALAERAISSAEPPLARRYSPAERAELATGTIEDWARESWQMSRDFLYPTAFGGKVPCGDRNPAAIVWTDEAITAALPLIDRRMEQAGLRLARMLDETLG